MVEDSDAASRKSARLGPTGEAVRLNIRRIRDAQGISGSNLSKRMHNAGRPIPLVGIQRIESGERRVDVDDLVAFALVLGVTPITLLMPETTEVLERVEVTGRSGDLTAGGLWGWLTARWPIRSGGRVRFLSLSLPEWRMAELEKQWELSPEDSASIPLVVSTLDGGVVYRDPVPGGRQDNDGDD